MLLPGGVLDAVDELNDELVGDPLVFVVQVHAVVEEDVCCKNTYICRFRAEYAAKTLIFANEMHTCGWSRNYRV